MYFAVLAPTIAFGGFLGKITHNQVIYSSNNHGIYWEMQ